MFYAGNGTLLVGFEDRKERDHFVKEHVTFGVERANREEAMNYPQFQQVKEMGEYMVLEPDGFHHEYWTNVVMREYHWTNKNWQC